MGIGPPQDVAEEKCASGARVSSDVKKRKAPDAHNSRVVGSYASASVIDLTGDDAHDVPSKRRKMQTAQKDTGNDCNPNADPPQRKETPKKPKDAEKRLKRWRSSAPGAYLESKSRALTQRMFVLSRERDTSDDHPTETISLAGTTGNVYTIRIGKVPSCDCPHARKGHQCKHIIYVLSRVLRVSGELEYQLGFLSSELRQIFAKAPALPSEVADKAGDKDGNRKPLEGDCPICFTEFDEGEATVYCKAACGNNVHATCMQQWSASKQGRGPVTCPLCRSPWETDGDDAKTVARLGPKNTEGYVNVASQLGLSGRRDYSTYNGYWVRTQAMNGDISWDEDGVMNHDY